MVRNGDITSGELVSFLLYLQSLSDAFSNIGYIFSSLTQAVGAADKGTLPNDSNLLPRGGSKCHF
jgi:ATP-binding cassette, subfamily B (MDR/TAP), member 9